MATRSLSFLSAIIFIGRGVRSRLVVTETTLFLNPAVDGHTLCRSIPVRVKVLKILARKVQRLRLLSHRSLDMWFVLLMVLLVRVTEAILVRTLVWLWFILGTACTAGATC